MVNHICICHRQGLTLRKILTPLSEEYVRGVDTFFYSSAEICTLKCVSSSTHPLEESTPSLTFLLLSEERKSANVEP